MKKKLSTLLKNSNIFFLILCLSTKIVGSSGDELKQADADSASEQTTKYEDSHSELEIKKYLGKSRHANAHRERRCKKIKQEQIKTLKKSIRFFTQLIRFVEKKIDRLKTDTPLNPIIVLIYNQIKNLNDKLFRDYDLGFLINRINEFFELMQCPASLDDKEAITEINDEQNLELLNKQTLKLPSLLRYLEKAKQNLLMLKEALKKISR